MPRAPLPQSDVAILGEPARLCTCYERASLGKHLFSDSGQLYEQLGGQGSRIGRSLRFLVCAALANIIVFFFGAATLSSLSATSPGGLKHSFGISHSSSCSPRSFDGGQWVAKDNPPHELRNMSDIMAALDVSVCKAQVLHDWNLGIKDAEPPYTERLQKALSYRWEPHPTCHMPHIGIVDKLQMLVDEPLLMAGDSRMRQHFFSLSCELGNYVEWRGEATEADGSTDTGAWRFATQHLFLKTETTAAQHVRLPVHWQPEQPLATFIMAYIPLNRQESAQLPRVGINLSDVETAGSFAVYELPMNNSIDAFAAPFPRYGSMLFSTGAHYNNRVFLDITEIDSVVLLRASVQTYFRALASRMRRDQRVYVIAAPGEQQEADAFSEPRREVGPEGDVYNYAYLPDLNNVLEDETQFLGDSRFQWLGTARLSRLRPDAHLRGDGVHFIVGSGVYEACSRYLWYAMQQTTCGTGKGIRAVLTDTYLWRFLEKHVGAP